MTSSSRLTKVLTFGALLLIIGCNSRNNTTDNQPATEINSQTSLLNSNNKDTKTDIASMKLELHKTMINHLDDLVVEDAFTHINQDNGNLETLYIVEHHPEIFIHKNKDNYVLCVSAKSDDDKIFPVDIYVKQQDGSKELVVYETKIGDKSRKALMSLMNKKIFTRM